MSEQYDDFKDNKDDFKLPLLAELEGKNIIIEEVKFDTSAYGRYAIIGLIVEGHEKAGTQHFRSGGKAILNQLDRIVEQTLSKGRKSRGSITKPADKNYFIIAPPL